MTTWREEAEELHNSISKADFDYVRVQIKSIDDNKVFSYYDKEAKADVKIGTKIKGYLLGHAFQVSVFDAGYGKNGGTYTTNLIFDFFNQKITVYSPLRKKAAEDLTYQEAKEWLKQNGTTKFQCVLFVKTLTNIAAITTNGTIAIDQINTIGKDFKTHLATFEVQKYSKESKISEKAKDALKKVALANPPHFAFISIADEVTDALAEQIGLLDAIVKYKEWVKFKTKVGDADIVEPEHEAEQSQHVETNRQASYQHEARETNSDKPTPPPQDDDLPF